MRVGFKVRVGVKVRVRGWVRVRVRVGVSLTHHLILIYSQDWFSGV